MLAVNGLAALSCWAPTRVAAPLAWFATRPLLWSATFVLAARWPTWRSSSRASAAIGATPTPNERRRIQIVVYTGVPGASSRMRSNGVPIAGGAAARPAGRSCRGRSTAVLTGARAPAGVRAALRGGGQARVQPAHGAAPQPAVRVCPAHAVIAARDPAGGAAARCRSSASAIARSPTSSSASRCSTRVPRACWRSDSRYRDTGRSAGSTGGSSAPSTTRARSSCRSPAGCRSRSDPRRAGRRWSSITDRLGAAPRVGGRAGRRWRRRLEVVAAPVRRDVPPLAAGQRVDHAAALVGRAARGVPRRRAVAGGAAAGRRTAPGWRRPTSRCWCRSSPATAPSRRWSA